jgi:uncharacterized protein
MPVSANQLTLSIMPETLAICRFSLEEPVPDWAFWGEFFSLTRTPDELSIVCNQADVPEGTKCEKDWRCLKVEGTLDFALTGILASLALPLADAKISIFALSTFDTDYLLVKESHLQTAIEALSSAGHQVEKEGEKRRKGERDVI